ncbi:hypothetical protein CLOM_g922 [Closterium sp. NIES-68]|nr:hypothetical protein CLOM_g922 [Closterium sp. NIES-68]GJP74546.1 hypothetical protein CLOP_g5108 [Closterium sp. NIES-67]
MTWRGAKGARAQELRLQQSGLWLVGLSWQAPGEFGGKAARQIMAIQNVEFSEECCAEGAFVHMLWWLGSDAGHCKEMVFPYYTLL